MAGEEDQGDRKVDDPDVPYARLTFRDWSIEMSYWIFWLLVFAFAFLVAFLGGIMYRVGLWLLSGQG